MKRILLCRHAKAEGLSHGITDEQRQLAPRGLKDAALVANNLVAKGYKPDLVVSSPAVRAVQTAKIFAGVAGYPEGQIRYERFIYNGYTTADFIDFLKKQDPSVNEVWLFGHNPDIASVAMRLCQGDFFHYPTSAVAAVSFLKDSWTEVDVRLGQLEYFVYPKMFEE